MHRYTFALDLVNDPVLIQEYEDYHQNVWPEIKASISDAGVLHMEIYRFENRLFMIMDVDQDFSFDKKSEMDANNPKVQEWEKLMWKYQQAIPGAKPGEKWVLMKQIFEL
ncbi:L-rhamnose mutarotase [Sphingobacterium psychroaquaticum]|uniref:L-rhamnose mutarotase n=1 Tax=Sphingobacterium psychroaquaticum TaxID=561061 RepID=A0A1X7I9E1_9SPHI|nr:L-rhamnose mutarotase [Sphingobacterium psychroaquaticum]QBQ41817.1 L-rhamnose mutarotase [Sphingobacterium psychroaquaticum]SMG11007.1 L-rhamnose mutarotase [Sphingobacterium psychroaquaticum]